jgi:integrase
MPSILNTIYSLPEVVSNSGSSGENHVEANSSVPQKAVLEKMARRRYQNARPHRRGPWWTLLVYRDTYRNGELKRRRQRVRIAPATMPVREARKVAAEYLRPLNQGLEAVGSAISFGEYVTNVYKPNVMSRMASTTRSCYEGVIRRSLEPVFGGLCLRELTVLSLERYFATIAAEKKSWSSQHKVREVLYSILGSAVRYELLVKNPCQTIKLGRKPKRVKPHVSPEQFQLLIAEVPEPYATMLYVAVWTGLRVSELVGLRWNDIDAAATAITVDERYCRGDWAQPKTEGSAATIAVDPSVIQRILALKELRVTVNWGGHGAKRELPAVRRSEPDDLVFQSVKTGAAMNENNILKRHIKPAGRKLDLPWVNWRCLRTSHATWLAVYAGVNPKDVQAQMRHSDIETTMNIYVQPVPESQRRSVARMAAMVAARTAQPEAVVQDVVAPASLDSFSWWASTAGTVTVTR